MKGRHLEKRGGQVFILKCFTSLRRFCWLQVNFSQATAYPAVRQVGAIVFQKAVAGQLPQMAPTCPGTTAQFEPNFTEQLPVRCSFMHSIAQNLVQTRLIAIALILEPLQHIGIDAHC